MIAFACDDELTCIYVTFLFMILGIFSQIIAMAPSLIDVSINSCPSAEAP